MITVLRLAEQLMSVEYSRMLPSRLTSSSDELLQHPTPKTTPLLSTLFESQDEKAPCLQPESTVDVIDSSKITKLHSSYQDASFSSLSHDLKDSIHTNQIASSRSHVCDGIRRIPRDNLQNSATPLIDRGNSAVPSPSPEGSTSNQEGLLKEHTIAKEVLQRLKAAKASFDRISDGESQLEELWQQELQHSTRQSMPKSLQYQVSNHEGQKSSSPLVTPSLQPVCNHAGHTYSIPPITPSTLQPVCNHAGKTYSIPPATTHTLQPVCNHAGQTYSIPPVTPTLQQICNHAGQTYSIPPATTPTLQPICNHAGQTYSIPPATTPTLQPICNHAGQTYSIPPVTPTLQQICNHAGQTYSIPPVTTPTLQPICNHAGQTYSIPPTTAPTLQPVCNYAGQTYSIPPVTPTLQPVLATSSPDQQGRVQQGGIVNGVMQRFSSIMAKLHNIRRQMAGSKTPSDVKAKNQKKGSLRKAVAQSATAPGSSPILPPEPAVIPILLENELEDVLSQGYPVCLGSGAHGEVHLKRKIVDGTLVAVKRLKNVQDPIKANQEMVTEIRTMMAVQHFTEFSRVLGIIDQQSFGVEFVGDPVSMTSTDLYSVLRNPPANLKTMDWIQICLDLSRGLLALHEAGWSHNDLHSGNVIIWRDVHRSHKWSAKIIDLGLATRLDPPPPVFTYDKSWCYDNCPQMPPEIIEGVCHHSIRTDVYSLGHLFNIITEKKAELSFINDIGETCLGLSQARPSLQSIIQKVERFQSETLKKIARNNAARGRAAKKIKVK